MKRALSVGAIYFAAVFALGFAFGALRVLLLAPTLGALPATLVELPIMLAASWWIAGRLVRRAALSPAQALSAGVVAFGLLMGAEAAVSIVGFGRTGAEHLAALTAPDGLAGLAAQLVFAVAPWAQARRG